MEEKNELDKLMEACSILSDMKLADKNIAREKIYNSTIRRGKCILLKATKIAAVILLPVICSLATYLYTTYHNENFINNSVVTVIAPPNGIMKYTLPDSSHVWLSKGSSLQYQAGIALNKRRNVELKGEGYFEVKSSTSRPFTVKIGELNVTATGTAFNCVDKDDYLEITLVEGLVNVENSTKSTTQELQPNEQIVLDKKTGNTILVDNVNCREFTAWKDGEFYFENSSLGFVIERLSRTYNIEFNINDKELLNKVVTAKFKDENIEEVIDIISMILQLEYEIVTQDNKKIIYIK